MDSDEIQSLAQEETRIRFWCNHTLNRNVNDREAAFRHRTGEGLDSQVFSNITMKFFGWVHVMTLVDRLPICGVLLSLLVVGNLHATEWQKVSRSINLSIYIRHRSDSPIEEVRGMVEFNAPILVLKGVLAHVAKCSEFIPLALAPSVRVPTGPSQ